MTDDEQWDLDALKAAFDNQTPEEKAANEKHNEELMRRVVPFMTVGDGGPLDILKKREDD